MPEMYGIFYCVPFLLFFDTKRKDPCVLKLKAKSLFSFLFASLCQTNTSGLRGVVCQQR